MGHDGGCIMLALMLFIMLSGFIYGLFFMDHNATKPSSIHTVVNGPAKPKLPTHLSKPPAIATPTIVLCVINFIAWITIQTLYTYNYFSYTYCLPIWSINVYIAFTPWHDAAHSSIATVQSGYRFLNSLVGRVSSILLILPFPLFKYIHLKHHKYTNMPQHDPDYWTVSGPTFLLPLKWFLTIFKYLWTYSAHLRFQPTADILEFFVIFIGIGYLIVLDVFEIDLFYQWIVPALIAATFLAFVFDYIPHRGHHDEDILKGTNVTSLYGDTELYKTYKEGKEKMIEPLTMPLLFQNYHNIHHLYPWIPFYKYSKVWYRFDQILLMKGTQIRSLLPIF